MIQDRGGEELVKPNVPPEIVWSNQHFGPVFAFTQDHAIGNQVTFAVRLIVHSIVNEGPRRLERSHKNQDGYQCLNPQSGQDQHRNQAGGA